MVKGRKNQIQKLLQCPLYFDLRRNMLMKIFIQADLGETEYDEVISAPQATNPMHQ